MGFDYLGNGKKRSTTDRDSGFMEASSNMQTIRNKEDDLMKKAAEQVSSFVIHAGKNGGNGMKKNEEEIKGLFNGYTTDQIARISIKAFAYLIENM